MKISTYRRPRSGYRLEVIVSNNGDFGSTYREATIFMENGQLFYNITDGYKWLDTNRPIRNNLKSAINIIWGKISPKPWYARGN